MAPPLNDQDVLKSALRGYWWDVIEAYMKHPESHEEKISKSGDTAIHTAISNGLESVVQVLVSHCGKNALAIGNTQGDTPLHLAAKMGSVRMCQCIAKKDSKLIGSRNENGETPLFLAVSHGSMDAFLCLNDLCRDEGRKQYPYYRRKNGDTILHSAISQGHFDIAFYIVDVYRELVDKLNEDGMSPLHLLASEPSFFPSGTHLTGLRKLAYSCLRVSKLEHRRVDVTIARSKGLSPAKSLRNVINLLKEVRRENHQRDEEEAQEQALETSKFRSRRHPWYRPYCITCLRRLGKCIFILMMRVSKLMLYIAGYTEFASLRRRKEQSVWSLQVMRKLLKRSSKNTHEHLGMCPSETPINEYQYLADIDRIATTKVMRKLLKRSSKNTHEHLGMWPSETPINECQYLADIDRIATTKMETPLLIAAKNGVVEMVERILSVHPDAIFDVNTEKKNIVMLAVENRHLPLYKFLLNDPTIMKTIFGHVDKDGNSVLHIAATMPHRRPWRIRGAALQMHMEIKWYKFVKHSMQRRFLVRHNHLRQTPGEIFRDTHQKLQEEGRQWLTNTSQSCSLVAALIATVAFATSATVPGGVKQDDGTPTLEKKPIFIISAVASLIALCSSMISVIMFLVILTSSFQHKDFRKDLPRKLLLGLIFLLVSIVSMLVSFFAGHHFVLKQELKHNATSVYATLCLPLVVFIIAMFPLDFEIVLATLINKEPQHCSKY